MSWDNFTNLERAEYEAERERHRHDLMWEMTWRGELGAVLILVVLFAIGWVMYRASCETAPCCWYDESFCNGIGQKP